jgi:diguanylate cyclase (GGDEF)-like protein
MNVILSTLLMISSLVLIVLGLVGFRHKGVSGVKAFSILMLAMAVHTIAYGFELLSPNLETMCLWIRVEYVAMSFYPFLIFWFAREYVGERKFANRYVMAILLILNIITLLLVQTNALHGWYYENLGVDTSLGFPTLAIDKGIWYLVQVATLYFAIGYALIVLLNRIINTRGSSRRRVIMVFAGMLVPLIASSIYLFGCGIGQIDLSPFSYIFLSLLVAGGLYRYDILFLSEVTHEMIFNTIEEAVIVVDGEGYILKINQPTSQLFEAIGQLKIGQMVNQYPVLTHIIAGNKMQTVSIGEQHYQIRLIPIGKHHGTIVVFTAVTEITEAKKQMEILAKTDQLTKLYNRRYFVDCFDQLEQEGVVMLMDIDHFKGVNDQYGHPAGDQVLCELAGCLNEHFSDGVICRYGGEEFALILENETLENAKKRGEKFRAAFQDRETDFPCTVSIGICWYKKEDYSKTMNLVDKLLYQAKNAGRNSVVSEESVVI